MSLIPPPIARVAFEVDARLSALSRRLRARLGLMRPLRILPYRGFGTAEKALVKARVLEDRHVRPPDERRTFLGNAVASYKRYATNEIPGARVEIRWEDRRFEGVTDDEGFLDVWVEPPPTVAPGWHLVELRVVDDPLTHSDHPATRAPVLVAGPEAEYAVISDIDDTVIVTGVTNVFKRAYALFISDARSRLPFAGVAAFYRALEEGHSGRAHNPIFYVSSSPWNLYEHIEEFLGINEIPFGPVLLRDWGINRHGFAPGGGHGHKLAKIRGVIDALPSLRFVLIGDSGQEDAEHYLTIVRERPGRVLAVYIRNVENRPGRDDQLLRIAEEMKEGGTAMLLVNDTEAAARDAAARRLIRWAEVAEVHAKKVEDEAAKR